MSNKKTSIPSGWTEDKVKESFEEAYDNDELTMIDMLGNEIPFDSKSDRTIKEMCTGEERDLPVDRILPVVKHLQGRILTIVDATYDDKERAKFVKDLVKEAFFSSSNWIYEMSFRDLENL